MVRFPLSPFERLAYERPALDLIAFYVAVDPFLGPPSNLVSLLLTSRTVYEHLCVKNNPHLYSEIFRYKFDVAALERRLSQKWTSAPCLANELRLRCVALKYIRHGRVAGLPDRDALWRSYLMMLDNDGRNEQQLCQWANLPQWALSAVALRCLPLKDYDDLPPDPEGTSLALWLLWMTKRVRGEGTNPCSMVLSSVFPLIFRGYQYPSLLAPDTYFYLPLCEEHDTVTTGFSGPTALVSSVHYCGHQLQLAVPPLTPPALLNYLVRREARQDNAPLHPQVAELPATRQEAAARGISSPALTQEDVAEFHYHTRTHFFNNPRLPGGRSLSETLDTEWFRLVSCHDLWDIERPLRGIVYSLGTLVGNWCGRMILPDTQAHVNAALDHHIYPSTVPMVQMRMSCRLEEHHCLRFSEPLVAPRCPNGFGEDVLNAWLPRNTRIRRKANGLQIFDPNMGKDTWYETYHPDRAQPYSAAACQRLLNESSMGWHRQSLSASATDDGEYEDYVEETLSGVQDIIVTGETSEKQGEAWGYYSYIGRVRRWDGLVVLLRVPVRSMFISSAFSRFISHHRSGGQTSI
ncbi:hypothetical protein EDC04DRAFT_2567997 [Pisolithus marmoratus]|nr:hypothetical protein EDC04DRAFT_2567997 [Pisolithus marmoratus]